MTDRLLLYLRVFRTFASNSLVRDMTFRANFIIDCISSISWMLMNLGFYLIVFSLTPQIGVNTGWGKYEFFVFLSTTLLINSLVQVFFMPNANELSERIRTGDLDFALLKPIDTQFLVSLEKVEWSSLSNFFFGLVLLGYSLFKLEHWPTAWQVLLYPIYVICGVAIFYSLTIFLASLAVWIGRNQSIYDFWFYITNFSRYPMEIYNGRYGTPLRMTFTWVIPILVVVNVPARLLALPLAQQNWPLTIFAIVAAFASLQLSRYTFTRALASYRSASS